MSSQTHTHNSSTFSTFLLQKLYLLHLNSCRKYVVFDPPHVSARGPHPREYRFHPRRILSESRRMSDAKFRRIFRITRRNVAKLLDMIEPYLPQGNSSNGMSIKPIERLLVFLYWSGSGSSSLHMGYAHDMAEGTIWECIDSIIDVLYDVVVPQLIQLPDENEARRQANLFHDKSRGFPRIVFGAIDGTHVRVSSSRQVPSYLTSRCRLLVSIDFYPFFLQINPPHAWRAECINRKNTHSINVMVLAGANHKIFACSTKQCGSMHDARVFHQSKLYQLLSTGQYMPFPGAIIIGDQGYPVS